MIILFDIDFTLFNTDCFRDNLEKELGQVLKISQKELNQIHTKYFKFLEKSTDFNPDNFVRFLGKEVKFDDSLIR